MSRGHIVHYKGKSTGGSRGGSGGGVRHLSTLCGSWRGRTSVGLSAGAQVSLVIAARVVARML